MFNNKKLCQLLIFLTYLTRKVIDWKIDDTLKWLDEIGLSMLIKNASAISLTGRQLFSLSENELIKKLHIEQDDEVEFKIIYIFFYFTHFMVILIADTIADSRSI